MDSCCRWMSGLRVGGGGGGDWRLESEMGDIF